MPLAVVHAKQAAMVQDRDTTSTDQ